MAESQDTTTYFGNFAETGPGIGNAGSYQVSGYPWLTGSTLADGAEVKITFPSVTKRVQIYHKGITGADTDTDIRLHFDSISDSGDVIGQHHYITLAGPTVLGLPAFGQIQANLKCSHLFLSSAGSSGNTARYEIVADLTGIAPAQMFELTGSGINSGV